MFTARAPEHSELPKKIFLDLAEANRRQLLAAGLPAKNIQISRSALFATRICSSLIGEKKASPEE